MTATKLNKSITDVNGVFANGIHCGIKAKKKDLAYIYVPDAVGSAALFTQNQFVGAPVSVTRKHVQTNVLKAVIINSGLSNVGTGERGIKDAKEMARHAASILNLRTGEVGVSSTGKIGDYLPMDKVLAGISTILLNPYAQEGEAAAEAILTTDLFTKTAFYEQKIGKKNIVVAGISKGSGMIAPNMATTLTFLVTNVSLNSDELHDFLKTSVDDSLNLLSVDGDTSTSDMVIILSTGEYKFSKTSAEERHQFQSLLTVTCQDLAKQIARDGEGATKLIEVQVVGAVSRKDARVMALNVINSPLVKTAIYGEDPNWGRIVAAACRDPKIKVNANKLALYLGDKLVFSQGQPVEEDRSVFRSALQGNEVKIVLDLHLGQASATAWGCDLTERYVKINVEYS